MITDDKLSDRNFIAENYGFVCEKFGHFDTGRNQPIFPSHLWYEGLGHSPLESTGDLKYSNDLLTDFFSL